mgnify:CR=1 FL=1
MTVQQKNFAQLVEMEENGAEGLVFYGCGGDLQEWVDGITKWLVKAGIAESEKPEDNWETPFSVVTTGGRIDLVLPFKDGAKINIGKLAIWRITVARGDASWISDYVVNYADQHEN